MRLLFLLLCVLPGIGRACCGGEVIDRRALVRRHHVTYHQPTPRAPLQVGNGEFALSVDITGLQTLPPVEGATPLGCMAQWAWHTFPESKQHDYSDTLVPYQVHGRPVTYATDRYSEAAQSLRANPHRFNLARISFRRNDGRPITPEEILEPEQQLVLQSGVVLSRFMLDGQPVRVRTLVHPARDAVGVHAESPLIADGRLVIEITFPYPAGVWGPQTDDWTRPAQHSTLLQRKAGQTPRVLRTLDATRYVADIVTNGRVQADPAQHSVRIAWAGRAADPAELKAVVDFQPRHDAPRASVHFDQAQAATHSHGAGFWSSGGAVDLSGSRDPRWRELERRVVLSQYLTAINGSGSMPPQETGLVCNSWFGKSHLEMHWWHAAHFALWGRPALLERSLGWYQEILPAARRIARRQGYAGVRWPKMTGPHGVSSPSDVGELLIWQQPHPIYFAELIYRRRPTNQTLQRYRTLVEETADFMASYAVQDEQSQTYLLGPVLIPAQECYDGRTPPGVLNPTFELAYWRWALRTACAWRVRMGLEAKPEWGQVAEKIAPPRQRDGIYTAIANAPYTRRRDHPSMLAALGVLPDTGLIDPSVMRRTLDDVQSDWNWAETWGWDYPMMAMTAARLGDASSAIDLLLKDTPKNRYLPNGHCWQAERLPLYLPANGGTLIAVAAMAAGWDGAAPENHAPGFPANGDWAVRHEGLNPLP